jgi:hypothetical protein
MAHEKIYVPVKFTDSEGTERTSYRIVGTLFENHRRGTAEVYHTIKLDFPVGFPPRAKPDSEETPE